MNDNHISKMIRLYIFITLFTCCISYNYEINTAQLEPYIFLAKHSFAKKIYGFMQWLV